jgi:anaerobic selenocysteine-containing dehydrogenase
MGDITSRKGICGICPAGCWVEVGIEHGRLVSIEPDYGHPLGMICRRGRHAPEIVYSEHRLAYPMKRVGPKGSHEFTRITWDEAYDEIVANLNRIKTESGPEAAAVYTGRGAFELSLCDMFQPAGIAVSSASNVLFPFGSPNTMGVGALCYVSFAMIAPHVTMGRMLVNMFVDIENAEIQRPIRLRSTCTDSRRLQSGERRLWQSIRAARRLSAAQTQSGFRSGRARTVPWLWGSSR